LRIVLLVSSLGAGGAERVATTLCNAWSARGDDVTLVATYSGGTQPFYDISAAVRVVYINDFVGAYRNVFAQYVRKIFVVRSLFRQTAPQVIVSFLQNVNVTTLISRSFLGIPTIVCERSDPVSQPVPALWKIARRLTYPYADLVTVQTNSAAFRLKSCSGWLKRVRAIPNPVPPAIRAVLPCRVFARRVLLSLGRLLPEKQVDKIIAAFGEVAADFEEWDLHIYGDGPARQRLSGQVEKLGMGNRVFFNGKTNEPWKKMAEADAFIMASKYEGFPNALLEAMAIGLPCIATDCPSGPREISDEGRGALLLPDADQQQIVRALRIIFGDEALRGAVAKRGRTFVHERFSLDHVLGQWDELFEEIGATKQ
jgi:GalNAc-alpha-(1->4)-GalNAc-alpha-(1->3)-diNAcBac-PP-undecaprenol alpha-1,4-N-acetyl-D-galactosaminyltransferase